jgi:serine protease Do
MKKMIARCAGSVWVLGPLAAALGGSLISGACARRTEGTRAEPSVPNNLMARKETRAAAFAGKDGAALADVAERTLPSIVSVASTRVASMEVPENFFDNPFFRRFFGPGTPLPFPSPGGPAPDEHGLGSGVIVGKDLILTNAHVVEGAKEIEVTAGDRRSLKAKVIGSDPKSDLAVLRITSDTSGLRSLEFTDSSQLRLGQVVLAVGNPFGVGQTVTMGIVSAKGRADLGIEAYEDFIQTDAAINPGNSGGALVDLEGKLVGIPTAILSRTGGYMGVGFAIPSNMAKPIMTSLVEHGKVVRGFLGVGIQNVDEELASALGLGSSAGVLISEVQPGGPAAKAGLQHGDVVLSLNGQPVQTTGQLRNLVAAAGVDAQVKLDIVRAGKRQTVTVKLADLPDTEQKPSTKAATPPSGKAGLSVIALDASTRQRLHVPPDVTGVLVTAVEPGSAAARASLRPGDVIVQVGKQVTTTPEQLSQAWDNSQGSTAALIWRDGHTFYAVIKH